MNFLVICFCLTAFCGMGLVVINQLLIRANKQLRIENARLRTMVGQRDRFIELHVVVGVPKPPQAPTDRDIEEMLKDVEDEDGEAWRHG